MTEWQEATAKRWCSEVMEGIENYDPAGLMLSALKLATWMMEAAMELPEWGRGFVQMASPGTFGNEEEHRAAMMEMAAMFPVVAAPEGGER